MNFPVIFFMFNCFFFVVVLFCILAARNHVNRMCLAADVPLVESGTAGYLGQATVIKKVSILNIHKIKNKLKTFLKCTCRLHTILVFELLSF